MNLNLKGKSALVSGSTQGIGKAIAIELANLGASVTLLARNEQKLTEVLEILFHAAGQSHQILVADFAKPNELKSVIEEHLAANHYHILVNNTTEVLLVDWPLMLTSRHLELPLISI